jgi:hypothetical protein
VHRIHLRLNKQTDTEMEFLNGNFSPGFRA